MSRIHNYNFGKGKTETWRQETLREERRKREIWHKVTHTHTHTHTEICRFQELRHEVTHTHTHRNMEV